MWRIITEIVTRRRELGGWDVHRVGLLGLLVLPQIEVHLFFLLLFPLALLVRLIRQDSALPNGADQLHDLLGLVLGREEASLGFRGTAEGCSLLALAGSSKEVGIVLTHLLLDGREVLHGIRVWVLEFIREETHLHPANKLQLLLTILWLEGVNRAVWGEFNVREIERVASVHVR